MGRASMPFMHSTDEQSQSPTHIRYTALQSMSQGQKPFQYTSGHQDIGKSCSNPRQSRDGLVRSSMVCATGATGFGSNSAAAVDEKALIDAAKAAGVKAFVLQTSLLTNAAAVGQQDNPNYRFLNLFGGVLDRKLAAEQYLRASGLRYTIVRPGGLSDKEAKEVGQLVVSSEDTLFGLDTEPGRVVSRDTVAEVLVAALRQPAAANKVVEIVANPTVPDLPEDRWFAV